jgi:uncharacterized paraquat-inducible protein A
MSAEERTAEGPGTELMALSRCDECGGSVSDSAWRCPRCGAEGADMRRGRLVLAVLALLAMLVAALINGCLRIFG